MRPTILIFFILPPIVVAQHDHHIDDASSANHNHLAHMQASPAQNFLGKRR